MAANDDRPVSVGNIKALFGDGSGGGALLSDDVNALAYVRGYAEFEADTIGTDSAGASQDPSIAVKKKVPFKIQDGRARCQLDKYDYVYAPGGNLSSSSLFKAGDVIVTFPEQYAPKNGFIQSDVIGHYGTSQASVPVTFDGLSLRIASTDTKSYKYFSDITIVYSFDGELSNATGHEFVTLAQLKQLI